MSLLPPAARCALALALLAAASAQAQPVVSPKHEMRAGWIATVSNLDWPSSRTLTTLQQQRQLLDQLDGAKAAGLNAVLFQVRPEADALYASPYEPWSYWLTNEQGRAPEPFWDPLAYAIEQAHLRGLELHAWLNPYRVRAGGSYTRDPSHVTIAHPERVLTVGSASIADPGMQVNRDQVARVVGDIVRRYAVDGIHFDDYFYPYPPNAITNQDAATYAADPRGITNVGDWRRDNINRMVAQVQDSINAIRPDVAFGISPFGIWRSGTPPGTSGLDAYSVIYADAVAWLNATTIDYVTPQLYWSSQRSYDTTGNGIPDTFNQQRYTTLAPWWESVRNGRHLYPGVAAYRAVSGSPSPGFGPEEIPTQVRYNRTRAGIDGTVFFRMRHLAGLPSIGLGPIPTQGLVDSLRTDLYRFPALTPSFAWKSQAAPGTPQAFAGSAAGGQVTLTWAAPAGGAPRYAVYRIASPTAPSAPTAPADGAFLLAVTGRTQLTDTPPAGGAFHYIVTAVSANSVESAPSGVVSVVGGVVSSEEPAHGARLALSVRPNPVGARGEAAFVLAREAEVTLRVVDALGREVASLLRGEARSAGVHAVAWEPGAGVSAGTYFLVLDADGQRAVRPLTVLR